MSSLLSPKDVFVKLLIMRHGQAGMNANTDAERALTDRGIKDAASAGKVLADLGLTFDALWVSPYLRTQQTADEVCRAYPELDRLNSAELTPEAPLRSLIESLKRSTHDSILLISHQPLVSDLVAYLTEPTMAYGPSMAPASMALVSSENLLPACGELLWLRHAPEFNRSH